MGMTTLRRRDACLPGTQAKNLIGRACVVGAGHCLFRLVHSLTELIADLIVSLLVEDLRLAFECLTFGTILHLADLFTDTLPDVLFDDVKLFRFP